jgi:hypothetical protein
MLCDSMAEEHSLIILSYNYGVAALEDQSMHLTRLCGLSLATVFCPAELRLGKSRRRHMSHRRLT